MQLDFKQLISLPIFCGICEEDLPAMLNCLGSFQKNYQKDEIVLLESNEVRNVGIILSGVVHMVKEDSEGYQTLLVTMKEGELFGRRGDQFYRLHESPRILVLAKESSGLSADAYVKAVLRESGLFEELETLPQFAYLAAADLQRIREQGAAAAMAAVTESRNEQ